MERPFGLQKRRCRRQKGELVNPRDGKMNETNAKNNGSWTKDGRSHFVTLGDKEIVEQQKTDNRWTQTLDSPKDRKEVHKDEKEKYIWLYGAGQWLGTVSILVWGRWYGVKMDKHENAYFYLKFPKNILYVCELTQWGLRTLTMSVN